MYDGAVSAVEVRCRSSCLGFVLGRRSTVAVASFQEKISSFLQWSSTIDRHVGTLFMFGALIRSPRMFEGYVILRLVVWID